MKATEDVKAVLNEAETAVYLRVSRATLRRNRMEGQREGRFPAIPFVRMGRSIRYLRRDLDAWLESHRVTEKKGA